MPIGKEYLNYIGGTLNSELYEFLDQQQGSLRKLDSYREAPHLIEMNLFLSLNLTLLEFEDDLQPFVTE